MSKSLEIFWEMQKLETKEEMIAYLRGLPKLDDAWPEEHVDEAED